MKKGTTWKAMFYGEMKTRAFIILLCLFIVLSWAFFIFVFLNLSQENFEVKISHEVESQLDDVKKMVNTLWEERAFEKEMKENLAYYLPEGFSSGVTYIKLTPLDLELGQAQVEFIHRHNHYSVNFTYYYDRGDLKIKRKSLPNLIKEN